MAVMSLVTARIAPERREEVERGYAEAVSGGLPDSIRQSFLMAGDADTMAIASVWHSRQGLEAMLATGEEPTARRLLREAGGVPEVTFFDVLVEAS
jgi:hypothetical protein